MEEELYLTLEQCKHLQELGLDMSDAAYAWDVSFNGKIVTGLHLNTKKTREVFDLIPTYTLQEILKKLPKISYKGSSFTWKINSCEERMVYSCGPYTMNACSYHESTILECAYSMLCWVLENGYLKK